MNRSSKCKINLILSDTNNWFNHLSKKLNCIVIYDLFHMILWTILVRVTVKLSVTRVTGIIITNKWTTKMNKLEKWSWKQAELSISISFKKKKWGFDYLPVDTWHVSPQTGQVLNLYQLDPPPGAYNSAGWGCPGRYRKQTYSVRINLTSQLVVTFHFIIIQAYSKQYFHCI